MIQDLQDRIEQRETHIWTAKLINFGPETTKEGMFVVFLCPTKFLGTGGCDYGPTVRLVKGDIVET